MLARKEIYYDYAPDMQTETLSYTANTTVNRPAPLIVTELDVKLRSKLRTVCLLVAVFATIVTIMSGVGAMRGYTLVETQQQTRALEEENERLKIEIAKLKAPSRIQAMAIEKLGMQMPVITYFSREGEY